MFRAEGTGGPDILLEQFLRAASTLGIPLLMLAFPKKQTTKKECLFQEDQLLLITGVKQNLSISQSLLPFTISSDFFIPMQIKPRRINEAPPGKDPNIH